MCMDVAAARAFGVFLLLLGQLSRLFLGATVLLSHGPSRRPPPVIFLRSLLLSFRKGNGSCTLQKSGQSAAPRPFLFFEAVLETVNIHPWHDLASGANVPAQLNVVVEIPRGSRNKYELDKDTGLFRFDRLLYSAVHYPGDYGFIPRTLAEDHDPLDVLIMTTSPTFTSCIVEVRPIGVFDMSDRGEMDEKILAVPTRDPLYEEFRDLGDVTPHFLLEVEHFFEIYKDLEGAQTKTMGWRDADAAHGVIRDAVARYSDVYKMRPERVRAVS